MNEVSRRRGIPRVFPRPFRYSIYHFITFPSLLSSSFNSLLPFSSGHILRSNDEVDLLSIKRTMKWMHSISLLSLLTPSFYSFCTYLPNLIVVFTSIRFILLIIETCEMQAISRVCNESDKGMTTRDYQPIPSSFIS